MAVEAVVREWHAEDGWGVVVSSETPDGCWTHFSHIAADGYRELSAGQAVMLEWEACEQDGYAFRALRVWAAGSVPVVPVVAVTERSRAAFDSTVTLDFDPD